MTAMFRTARALVERYWSALAGLVAVLMLASAHMMERFADLPACGLCLRQREVYWATIAIVVIGAAVWLRRPEGLGARAVEALVGGAFLTGGLIATYHAGAEWGFWDPPATCGGIGAPFDPEQIFNPEASRRALADCGDAPVRILGLSIAGWNALISLGLAAVSFRLAARDGTQELEITHA